MSLTIEVVGVKYAEARMLQAMERLLNAALPMNRAAAEGVLPVVQQNFHRLAVSNRNRFGVRSSFWNRMLSGTRASATAEAGRVSMPREVALRYFGGTVTPKAAKYLTLPLRAEAYGKSPKQFDNIKFARIGGKLFAFTTDLNESGRSEETGSRTLKRYRKTYKGRRRITLLYLLTKSATIKPDDTVLPARDAMIQGAGRGVKTLFDVTIARANQNAGGAEA